MLAYVDTSVIVAVTLGEIGAERILAKLTPFRLHSAPLLEAEWRSACQRNGAEADLALLAELTWIHPDRVLSPELERAFGAGAVRGADAWHLATALFLAPDPSELTFLTLDDRQRAVAEALGFPT